MTPASLYTSSSICQITSALKSSTFKCRAYLEACPQRCACLPQPRLCQRCKSRWRKANNFQPGWHSQHSTTFNGGCDHLLTTQTRFVNSMPQNLHNLKPLRNPHDRRFEPLLLPWSLTTLQSAKKREAVTVPGVNKWTPCLVFDKRQLVCFEDAVRRRRKKRKKDSIGVSQTFSSSPKWRMAASCRTRKAMKALFNSQPSDAWSNGRKSCHGIPSYLLLGEKPHGAVRWGIRSTAFREGDCRRWIGRIWVVEMTVGALLISIVWLLPSTAGV